MSADPRPRPRAFRLSNPDVVRFAPDMPEPELRSGAVVVTEDPLETIEAADGTPVPLGARRRTPWGTIFASALGGLLALGFGLALERWIADLFAAVPWLGWLALGLAALAGIAFLAILAREIAGVWRERRIERLRESALAALRVRDHAAAKAVVADLLALYDARSHAERAGSALAALGDEILEPEDRLAIAERELLRPLDAQAKRAIAGAAKQVSVVTALSPRAIVDVAFVMYAAARLLGRIARIYGARPGALGFLRLFRAAIGHLAVTGGVAVGDSLVQQVLGLGLAARISAKLGEGVLNGLITARFGLAALAVCRPLPFVGEEAPRLGDVAGELVTRNPGAGPAAEP